jgi:hypothetical protein
VFPIDVTDKEYYNNTIEMDNYRTRRFISIAVVVIIIGAAIFGLFYIGNLLFFSSSGNSILNKTNTHESDLLSTTANRAVRMNVRGPIVADENFRSLSDTNHAK